ncbi:hypothetical protein SeLEV6574_g03939 [Synchytrium endobioticum]|uniref:RNB domain-containing protein n=1 Tax=Synchytrium endobioticum TaxID=286115 RepID=A0A507D1K9_9FUNG|nr:hypothetical protein SeLEV6574_g03939 [Synchytrium endobioticum]
MPLRAQEEKDKVILHGPADASVTVHLHGCTITSWIADERERLFLSEDAVLDGSKSIRGGIPLVFPIFGTVQGNPLPQHGFARSSTWKWCGVDKGTNDARFDLTNDQVPEDFSRLWQKKFHLTCHITLGAKELTTRLVIRNTDTTRFEFQTLFHTYFSVTDIAKVAVLGLKDFEFTDKVVKGAKSKETRERITIDQEVDRVYESVNTSRLYLEGPGIEIYRANLPDVVLWNPWKENKILRPNEYKEMIHTTNRHPSLARYLEKGLALRNQAMHKAIDKKEREDLLALQTSARSHSQMRLRNGLLQSAFGDTDLRLFWPDNINNNALVTTSQTVTARKPVYPPAFPSIRLKSYSPDLSPSHILVSESMVIAGRVAAMYSKSRKLPVPYRGQISMFDHIREHYHPSAQDSAVATVQTALASRDPTSGLISPIEYEAATSYMPPANISTSPLSQFSMGIPDGYVKVTSPLRRYLDLLAHIQIKSVLLGGRNSFYPTIPSKDVETIIV